MGYLLVTAVLVVTLGRLGDMLGRVKIYNLGFVVFTIASILLSIEPFQGGHGALWLIGFRVVQGVGGAMLMANSTAILTDAFSPNERGMALGINQVAALAGSFIGLVAGKAIPSPVPYADVVCFTTHKVLRGPRGGMILARAEHAKAIDKAVFPFSQGGPLMHAIAAKAVAMKEAAQPEYQAYAAQVIANAQALAKSLEAEGMRAVSGGTDTHLALVDLRPIGITGDQAETRCDAARITLNKNAIPYDPAPPLKPSGLRVGSPSVTTQGMVESDMAEIGALLGRAVRAEHGTAGGDAELADVAEAVSTLVARAPAYPRP